MEACCNIAQFILMTALLTRAEAAEDGAATATAIAMIAAAVDMVAATATREAGAVAAA